MVALLEAQLANYKQLVMSVVTTTICLQFHFDLMPFDSNLMQFDCHASEIRGRVTAQSQSTESNYHEMKVESK